MTSLPRRYSNPRLWKVQSGDVSLAAMRLTAPNAVQKIISHEGFDPHTFDNDVALMKLKTPLTFSGEHLQNGAWIC